MTVAATSSTVNLIWWVSILLAVVVTAVVAVLLAAVLRSTHRICKVASDIWTVGQTVANNTVHIALLDRTNHLAAGILKEAGLLAAATQKIEQAPRRGGT